MMGFSALSWFLCDYKGAAAQFDIWNKVKGKVVQGLVNRRAKERKLFEKAL